MSKYDVVIWFKRTICILIGGAVVWAYMSYMWLEADYRKLLKENVEMTQQLQMLHESSGLLKNQTEQLKAPELR